jgi:hypothetical protein
MIGFAPIVGKRRRMTTLEEYLRQNVERNVIDHSIRAEIDDDGHVNFYIHPAYVDGETVDFTVDFNSLGPNPNVTVEGSPVKEDVKWDKEGF